MQDLHYIGRFAPSPTGSLHLGSLVAAMASYCQASKNKGEWIVRIEDLDPPREIIGASKTIITTLQKLGFKFDQKILFQSNNSRQLAYQQALDKLTKNSHTYKCSCSRLELKIKDTCNHTCRYTNNTPNSPYSIKLKVPNQVIEFNDKVQNKQSYNLLYNCGDVVLKRKDGLFSYQIAVVVDDNHQNISEIVRGIDLIESTPWQIYLNSLLGYKQANYAHLPILVNDQNQKLSKQTFAKEVDNKDPLTILLRAYKYLNQKTFSQQPTTISDFWHQAICNWNLNKIAKTTTIKV